MEDFMKKRYWFIFWAAAVLLLFFMNGSLLITDSVESNYALTAKEMVLSGDWISPQIYGRYWYDKPIMSYWLIALGFKLFGFTEFGARFFPALSGLAGLWLAAWGGKKLFSEKVGFYSGVILLTTLEFFTISKSILTDGMLFFFFNAALLFFYLGYSTENKRYYYGTYAFSALATLTKGPIGFLLPGLILVLFLLWERNWRELKNVKLVSGTLLFFLLAGPWYYAMMHLHADFFGQFLGTHNFLRATVSEHPRDNVIYYYTAINVLASFAWIGFFPGMLKNIIYKAGKWVMPLAREKFLLLWFFVIFFFYQNMATKYITYTYPILLPLAYLLAAYICEQGDKLNVKGALGFNLFIYVILTATAVWLSTNKPEVLADSSQVVMLTGVCALGVLWACWKKWLGASWNHSVVSIACVTFIFNLVAIKALCQPLMFEASGYAVAQYVNKNLPQQAPLYIEGGYPTSAVFYTGREIPTIIDDNKVEEFLPKGFSWSAKNVMPYRTVSEVKAVKNLAVIVPKSSVDSIQKKVPGKWQVHNIPGKWVLVTKE